MNYRFENVKCQGFTPFTPFLLFFFILFILVFCSFLFAESLIIKNNEHCLYSFYSISNMKLNTGSILLKEKKIGLCPKRNFLVEENLLNSDITPKKNSLFVSTINKSEGNLNLREKHREKRVNKTLLLSIIPAGGHLYLGDTGTAISYLLVEGGLVYTGSQVKNKLKDEELNIFYAHSVEVYKMSVYTAYESAKKNSKNNTTNIKKSKIKDLFLAPFRWKYLKSSYVQGAFLAGLVSSVIESAINKERQTFNQVESIQMIGYTFDRNTGLFWYETSWLALSLNAAVSEESFYRGVVQNRLEESLGSKRGLIITSIIFGLGHVYRPSEIKYWVYGGLATLSGVYLGWLYQKNNYHLGEPIAAHFWFNFAAGTTLFFLDPKNNPLRIKINLR